VDRHTFTDAVGAPHELAAQAGLEILAAGGNAVDAAIAANAVQGVVAPETCGIGGDLFALVWRPGLAEPLTLNASGPAGSNARIEELAGESDIPLAHPLSVTVPGCVAGWEALAAECGRMPLADLLAPAIRLATDGFPASAEMATAFSRRESQLGTQASASDIYEEGTAPIEGQLVRRRMLAQTLTELTDGGARAFYQGPAGRAIVEAVGGRITPDDLASYRPDWVTPLQLDVFGRTGWTIPPNSQGYLTLAATAIFEQLDAPADPVDPEYVHLLIESYRSVAGGRDQLVSDPSTAASTAELLGEDLLADLRRDIDRSRAGRWPAPARQVEGTAYLCAVDRDGIGISLMQSNFHGIGSGIGAGAAGFFLHNRGAGFTLEPGHRNVLAPGRRPLHTLAPTLWTRDGGLELILGTRGGHQQPQLLAQVAAHVFHCGLTPGAAQEVPRWTTRATAPHTTSTIAVENRMPAATVEALRQGGHEVTKGGAYEGGWGPVSMIHVLPSGLRVAAADPRVATAAAAVR